MELKAYQEKVLQDIDQYLSAVDQTQSLSDGWNRYWEKQGITVGAGCRRIRTRSPACRK